MTAVETNIAQTTIRAKKSRAHNPAKGQPEPKPSHAALALTAVPQWKQLRTVAATLEGLSQDNSFTVDSDVVVMLAAQLGPNLNAFDSVGEHGRFQLDGADGWTDVLDIERTLTLLGTHCAADGVPASVVDFLTKTLSGALDALAEGARQVS